MIVGLLAITVRFALYLDLMTLFGLAAFGLYGLRGAERRSGAVLSLVPWLVCATLLGAGLSALGLLILAASVGGVPLDGVDRATVAAVLWDMAAGTAWLVRMAALALALSIVVACRNRPVLALAGAALAGGVALGSLAWTGHGAMNEGAIGWIQLVADIVHLLAAGVWVGALLALALLVFRGAERMDREHLAVSHRVLAGFSTTGALVVAAIVASGLTNAWLLVGPANVGRLPATQYGRLLIVKLFLFVRCSYWLHKTASGSCRRSRVSSRQAILG